MLKNFEKKFEKSLVVKPRFSKFEAVSLEISDFQTQKSSEMPMNKGKVNALGAKMQPSHAELQVRQAEMHHKQRKLAQSQGKMRVARGKMGQTHAEMG